jgi:hypothetical protein
MATITGTPLQITTAFYPGAVAQTTASDNGTFSPPSATNGVASHEHPTGSNFQWFDFTEDDHYEIFVEVPTAITNTTQITSELEVTMNGVMLCMRNNVFNFTASDRHFFKAFLIEEYTTVVGGQNRTNRRIYPSEIFEPQLVGGVPNTDDFIWYSGMPVYGTGAFLEFVEAKTTTAQQNLTKQFFTTNYQADSNGLQEPFPLAESSPFSYTTFDNSALTPTQKFKLNLRDMPGFDGKFTASGTNSKFYIYIIARPDLVTYGSEAFALGIETFDIKATRSPDGFAAHLTLQSPVPLSTNVNVADTDFTRAFVGSTTYPLSTAFNTTSALQQDHNSTAAQFNITTAFNQPDTLAGFLLTSPSALSTSFTWDTFHKTNQIGLVFAGESTQSFAFGGSSSGLLATTGTAIALFDITLASSSLGTTVQHTTPATVSTAIDFEQTGLAGLIFAGESTQSTAFSQSDIANNQVFTIRAPSDKQVYTTDTDTRTVVLNQHNRTHTMGTETREIQLNTHNRTIAVEQQTRTITAEALDE